MTVTLDDDDDDTTECYYMRHAIIETCQRDVRRFVESTALRFDEIYGYVERQSAPKDGNPGRVKVIYAVAWPRHDDEMKRQIVEHMKAFRRSLERRYGPDAVKRVEADGDRLYDAESHAFKLSQSDVMVNALWKAPRRFSVVKWGGDKGSAGDDRSEVSRIGDFVFEPIPKSPTPSQSSRK